MATVRPATAQVDGRSEDAEPPVIFEIGYASPGTTLDSTVTIYAYCQAHLAER